MLAATHIKDARTIAWDHALTSRMNITYYQRSLAVWGWVDGAAKVASGVASSVALVLLLQQKLPALVPWCAGSAALFAVVAASLNVPAKVRALAVLNEEYIGHLQVFEALVRTETGDAPSPALTAALERFHETERREGKDHPSPSRRRLARAQRDVLQAIGAPTP